MLHGRRKLGLQLGKLEALGEVGGGELGKSAVSRLKDALGSGATADRLAGESADIHVDSNAGAPRGMQVRRTELIQLERCR